MTFMQSLDWAQILMIVVFVGGYLALIFEYTIKVHKTTTILLMAVLTWALVLVSDQYQLDLNTKTLDSHVGNVSQIIFLLIAAISLVEIISNITTKKRYSMQSPNLRNELQELFQCDDTQDPQRAVEEMTAKEQIEFLIVAIQNNKPAVVHFVIQLGVDINGMIRGTRPLHSAANFGHLSILNFLLEKKVDIDSLDEFKNTPLFSAAYHGHLEIVKKLLERGANLEATNIEGQTPLHYACRSKHNRKIVSFLIDQGANIESKDIASKTPLFWAVSSGDFKLVEHLIDQGANINTKDVDLRSPLTQAILMRQKKITFFLIEKAADFLSTDKEKTELFHMTSEFFREEVYKELTDCISNKSD